MAHARGILHRKACYETWNEGPSILFSYPTDFSNKDTLILASYIGVNGQGEGYGIQSCGGAH